MLLFFMEEFHSSGKTKNRKKPAKNNKVGGTNPSLPFVPLKRDFYEEFVAPSITKPTGRQIFDTCPGAGSWDVVPYLLRTAVLGVHSRGFRPTCSAIPQSRDSSPIHHYYCYLLEFLYSTHHNGQDSLQIRWKICQEGCPYQESWSWRQEQEANGNLFVLHLQSVETSSP